MLKVSGFDVSRSSVHVGVTATHYKLTLRRAVSGRLAAAAPGPRRRECASYNMKCLVSGGSGAHPSAPRLSLKHHQSIKKYPITYNILNRDNIRRRATSSSQVRANNEGEQSINSELIVYPNCVAKSFCHFIYKLVSRFKATQPGFNSRDPQS